MKKSVLIIFASILFVFVLFLHSSAGKKFYAISNANYYKNKNTEKALFYYEKSFENDNTSLKDRKNYYELLIKDEPLDTEKQQKLLDFILIPVDDTVKLQATNYLNNIRELANAKYPQNYISQASFNKKILRWSNMPISYEFIDYEDVPEYYINEIENAFSKWEKATNYKLFFNRDNNNPNIIIKFNKSQSNLNKENKYIIAYTSPEIKNNKLKNMIMDFYIKDADDEYFSNNQIYNTALHEIGHAIGFMGHSNKRRDVMNITIDIVNLTNDLKSELSQSDINTIKFLYSIKPDITDSEIAKGEYISYIALGNEKDISKTKLLEAQSYIKNAPNLATGYIDLAEGFVAQKEYEKAKKSLLIALEHSNTQNIAEMIYYNLVVVDYYLKEYEEALSYIEELSELSKEETLENIKARIYKEQGKTKKAIEIYNSLIKNNPYNIDYAIELANIHISVHNPFAARKVLKNFLKNNPNERKNERLKSYGILIFNL